MATETKKQFLARKQSEYEGMTQEQLRDELVPLAQLKDETKNVEDLWKIGAAIFFARADKKEGRPTVELDGVYDITRSSSVCVDLEAQSFTQCKKEDIKVLRMRLNKAQEAKEKAISEIKKLAKEQIEEMGKQEGIIKTTLEDIEKEVARLELEGDKFDHKESRVCYKTLVKVH